MSTLFRGGAAFILILAAAMFFVGGLLPANTEGARRSLANQRAMHADMIRMGRFTEEFRQETNRLPSRDELIEWMATQKFEYYGFVLPSASTGERNIALAVVPVEEEFIIGEVTDLPRQDGHTYRIAYWNNWTEEYAPETGSHTFATSISDYATPMWQRVLAIVLALGLAVLAVRILRRPRIQNEVMA